MTPKTQSVCKHCQHPIYYSEFYQKWLHYKTVLETLHTAEPVVEPASTGGAAVAPIVMGTSVLIPLNRYNEFVEFESGRSIKALSLFAADIEDTLHAIANIVGIKDRLDLAIIEAVRKLAAQSSPKDE